MTKRYTIQLRRYDPRGGFDVLGYIQRVLRAEQIGNFNPLFCRYRNDKRVLVHSAEGDLSDPFRRDDSYTSSLYIKVQS